MTLTPLTDFSLQHILQQFITQKQRSAREVDHIKHTEAFTVQLQLLGLSNSCKLYEKRNNAYRSAWHWMQVDPDARDNKLKLFIA